MRGIYIYKEVCSSFIEVVTIADTHTYIYIYIYIYICICILYMCAAIQQKGLCIYKIGNSMLVLCIYGIGEGIVENALYITEFGGARGVIVIVEEMNTATRVQILDETDCISHSTNTLGKGMNPKYSLSSYG